MTLRIEARAVRHTAVVMATVLGITTSFKKALGCNVECFGDGVPVLVVGVGVVLVVDMSAVIVTKVAHLHVSITLVEATGPAQYVFSM